MFDFIVPMIAEQAVKGNRRVVNQLLLIILKGTGTVNDSRPGADLPLG